MEGLRPIEVHASSKGVVVVEGERGDFKLAFHKAESCDVDAPSKQAKCKLITKARQWSRTKLGTVRQASNPGMDWDWVRAMGRREGVIYATRKSGREPAMRTLRGMSKRAIEAKYGKQRIADRAFKEMVWRTGFREGMRDGERQTGKRNPGSDGSLNPRMQDFSGYEEFAVKAARRVLSGKSLRGWEHPTGGPLKLTKAEAAQVIHTQTGRWPRGWAKKGAALRKRQLAEQERRWVEQERNPAGPGSSQAQIDSRRLYKKFHGKTSTETVEVRTPVKSRTDLAELGVIQELRVVTVPKEKFEIPFPEEGKDSVMLCSSPDGQQLYFEGGDQTLDLRQLGLDGSKWMRDFMVIGVLTMVTYRTEKGFDKFELTDYWHKLGEDTGVQPMLVYDTINNLLSVVGGQYEVRPEGIVN